MPDELTERVIRVIAASQKIVPDKVTPESTFQELGIDSLDGITIVFELEKEFDINIPDEQAQGIRSVGDVVESLRKLLDSGPDAGVPVRT